MYEPSLTLRKDLVVYELQISCMQLRPMRDPLLLAQQVLQLLQVLTSLPERFQFLVLLRS